MLSACKTPWAAASTRKTGVAGILLDFPTLLAESPKMTQYRTFRWRNKYEVSSFGLLSTP